VVGSLFSTGRRSKRLTAALIQAAEHRGFFVRFSGWTGYGCCKDDFELWPYLCCHRILHKVNYGSFGCSSHFKMSKSSQIQMSILIWCMLELSSQSELHHGHDEDDYHEPA
jgi:hypothetical protein